MDDRADRLKDAFVRAKAAQQQSIERKDRSSEEPERPEREPLSEKLDAASNDLNRQFDKARQEAPAHANDNRDREAFAPRNPSPQLVPNNPGLRNAVEGPMHYQQLANEQAKADQRNQAYKERAEKLAQLRENANEITKEREGQER